MAEDYGIPLTTVRGAARAEIDAGLRAYMLRVYNYMASGVVLSGIVAYVVANTPALFNAIFGTPLMWVVILAPLGLVFLLSARVHKMSAAAAQASYWVFAGLMGLSLATVFAHYTGVSVARVFFITAGTFGAMSLYGYTTKRDLTNIGSFLFMGLIGIIIASVVNLFLASSALHFAISVIGVLVFVGLTAFDTQRIKSEYLESDSAEIAGKKAILGALRLYLDFINLFTMLLSLFGQQRE
ncbi:MAG: Bax inhibitor-1/YccA family protein [Alphaproteobacteria bacterium]|nr:Bax inhibitor-1/YccA family protein [Alphaproteobacteria bacterium]